MIERPDRPNSQTSVVTVAGTGQSANTIGSCYYAALNQPRVCTWQPPIEPPATEAGGGSGGGGVGFEQNLYIACHWTIRRLNFKTGLLDAVPIKYQHPINPSSLVFANPTTLIVSGFHPQRALFSIDVETGATELIAGRSDRPAQDRDTIPCVDGLALGGATLSTPCGICISYSDQVVYIADRDTNRVRRFDVPTRLQWTPPREQSTTTPAVQLFPPLATSAKDRAVAAFSPPTAALDRA